MLILLSVELVAKLCVLVVDFFKLGLVFLDFTLERLMVVFGVCVEIIELVTELLGDKSIALLLLIHLRLQHAHLLLLSGNDLLSLSRFELFLLDFGLQCLHIDLLLLNHFLARSNLFLKFLSEGAHEGTEHLVAIGLRVESAL